MDIQADYSNNHYSGHYYNESLRIAVGQYFYNFLILTDYSNINDRTESSYISNLYVYYYFDPYHSLSLNYHYMYSKKTFFYDYGFGDTGHYDSGIGNQILIYNKRLIRNWLYTLKYKYTNNRWLNRWTGGRSAIKTYQNYFAGNVTYYLSRSISFSLELELAGPYAQVPEVNEAKEHYSYDEELYSYSVKIGVGFYIFRSLNLNMELGNYLSKHRKNWVATREQLSLSIAYLF